MNLVSKLSKTPRRRVGRPGWLSQLTPAQRREVDRLVAAKASGALSHSYAQIAEELIARFHLAFGNAAVRFAISRMVRAKQGA